MAAGHKWRLSEAGLRAVSGLMGRHLTPREWEALEKKNWQPEPGLSYSPSGEPGFDRVSQGHEGCPLAELVC